MTTSFVTQLGVFRRKGIRNMRLVASMAIRDVLEGAQTPQRSARYTGGAYIVGKIPVLHNILRENLMSGKNGGSWTRGSTSYLAVTSGLQMGDVLSFYWDTPYALRIEKGFRGVDSLGRNYNQGGRFYVATSVDKFPQFLRARAAEVNKK